jgi:L-methionine (R)-S-oxide reductase
MPKYKEMLEEFEGYVRASLTVEFLMESIARRLHEHIARYNWVGFYLIENSVPKVLVLGPHSGSFTPHARIPLDRGLCGAAATTEKTVVVNNVAADLRYIGSDMVKSNMVVPIKVKNRMVGELDIESYFADTFSKADQEFVECCAALVGRYMEIHH